ncbi:unnamed protein product, partial [Ectocarpus sp. 12 AP-2014]
MNPVPARNTTNCRPLKILEIGTPVGTSLLKSTTPLEGTTGQENWRGWRCLVRVRRRLPRPASPPQPPGLGHDRRGPLRLRIRRPHSSGSRCRPSRRRRSWRMQRWSWPVRRSKISP